VSGLLQSAVSFRGCTGEIRISAGWVGPDEGTPRGCDLHSAYFHLAGACFLEPRRTAEEFYLRVEARLHAWHLTRNCKKVFSWRRSKKWPHAKTCHQSTQVHLGFGSLRHRSCNLSERAASKRCFISRMHRRN